MKTSLPLAGLALALVSFAGGVPTGTVKSRTLLVGVTTGSDDVGGSEVVTIDAAAGKTETIGRLVPPKGHRLVQAQDLAWSADGKTLLVAQLAFGAENETRTWIEWVDASSLKVTKTSDTTTGVIDSLCWDGSGRLLATHGVSRPQKLITVDPDKGTRVEIGELDARLWIKSLVWDAKLATLWALHLRTPELDHDALVTLSPKDGAVSQIVKLDLGEIAMALALDARGGLVLFGDKGGLFQVDPKTGKTVRAKDEYPFRVNGLVLGR